MKVYFREIGLSTRKQLELVDIKGEVSRFVTECGMESGICLVDCLHSTTAIIVNEHESGLVEDILRKVQEEFPKEAGWHHDRVDNNANAHLASVFLGHSKKFPARNGRLEKGTWQNIFLLEADGPRTRQVLLEAIGV